jgi:hypothetical protein
MSKDKAIQVADRAEISIDVETTGRVLESIVTRGDISALSPEERSRYYLQVCDSLGLTPATLPFLVLRLNGKEIMYPTRSATDQLAAIHRINREIIDGPKVIDLAGTKLVYAVCKATHPNGRIETSVATVPLADPANVMMKVETKSKRRATLSILGLGMLSQDEVDDLPASDKQPAQQVNVTVSQPPAPELEPPSKTPALDKLRADLADGSMTLIEACRIWLKHKEAVGTESSGDIDYVYDAQKAVLGALLVASTANQMNEHITILETRAAADDKSFYAMVLDLLELTDQAQDVVEVWQTNSSVVSKVSSELQLLLKKAATRRVQELDPALADVRKAGQWLKSQLSPKGDPPNGGGAPRPEATETTAANGAAAESVDMNAEDARLRAALSAIDNKEHLARHVAAHEHEYGLPEDVITMIALTRFEQIGQSRQLGVNMLRVARNGRRKKAA